MQFFLFLDYLFPAQMRKEGMKNLRVTFVVFPNLTKYMRRRQLITVTLQTISAKVRVSK